MPSSRDMFDDALVDETIAIGVGPAGLTAACPT
jgi:hypothetical protein